MRPGHPDAARGKKHQRPGTAYPERIRDKGTLRLFLGHDQALPSQTQGAPPRRQLQEEAAWLSPSRRPPSLQLQRDDGPVILHPKLHLYKRIVLATMVVGLIALLTERRPRHVPRRATTAPGWPRWLGDSRS